jgi:regulation of enolase protein 1 (concanavalin A-like superfamily)
VTGDAAAAQRRVDWSAGSWLNPPPAADPDGDDLLVTAAAGSDFWRTTSYGFIHEDGHALLVDLPDGTAVEVSFVADFPALYDQAGVLVRVDERHWIKAGVETSDDLLNLAAVVTHGVSDWSLAPVPDWSGRSVTVRASRSGNALTIRARVEAEPWRMVRLAPLDPAATASAGPFCCAPQREGLRVRFTGWTLGPADAGLHEPPG